MLPDGFEWTHVGASVGGPDRVLHYRFTEVARLIQRVGGAWYAILNRVDGPEVHRECTDRERGMAGIELWAERHQARLVAECEARHKAWAARQTWRRRD